MKLMFFSVDDIDRVRCWPSWTLCRLANICMAQEAVPGHFSVFGPVAIGHELHQGCQRVKWRSFKDMLYYGSNRQDFVSIWPPGIDKGRFQCPLTVGPDNL